MPEPEATGDPVLRASAVFESWRDRQTSGRAEPFEELLAHHDDLRASLERLRRMDALLRGTLERAAPSDPVSSEVREKMLGDYRIVRELGRGAMGIVFEAEQVSLHRRVALKVLPAHLTLNERALKRFQHEAEITARLNHRNIVGIHQVGEVAGVHFIAMELIEGTSLDKVIERMRRESFESVRKKKIGDVVSAHGIEDSAALTGTRESEPERGTGSKKGSSSASNKNYIETAVRLVCQVADALYHAHQAGVIHRDIKPSNIMVRPDGTPVLTDFGLAREDGLPSVSITGDFAGTPNFVSPEQAMSGRMPVDHRADIFSLGATLYELLTLELAFPGENIQEVLTRIITKSPRDPQKLNPALAPDLVTIVLKALEKDPDRRYQNAAELAADLRAFIEYRSIRAKRTPTVVRAWRWVKREPMKAGFYAALMIGIPTTAILGRGWLAASSTLEARGADLLEGDLKKAFLALGLGRHLDAEQEFRGILERDGASLEAIAGLSLALLNQKRPTEALTILKGFESHHGESGITRRLRADALRVEGRDRLAQALEAELLEPESALEQYVEGLRLLRGTTYQLTSGKDTALQSRERARTAVGLLNRATFSSPERASFNFALAWGAWVARDEEKARVVEEAIARKWPKEAMAWFFVGVAREVYDEAAAIEALEHAIELDSGLTEAVERRAILLLRLGDSGQAVRDLERLGATEPDRPEGLANLAAVQYEAGRLAEAVDAARKALVLEPDLVSALDTLGSALYRKGELGEAREALARAVELEPTGAHLHNDLGQTLLALGEQGQACEHLERARELDPENSLYLGNLGLALFQSGKLDRAASLLEKAVEAFDRHPSRDLPLDQVLGALGYCFEKVDRSEEAVATYERAARLAPENPQHALNLGGILHELGRHAQAVPLLERAIAGGMGDERAHRALVRSLQNLRRWPETLAAAVRWTKDYPNLAEAWNERAWPQVDPEGDPSLRNPEDALSSAEKALGLLDSEAGEDPGMLDTLAWALFWSGERLDGLAEERRAIELARDLGQEELAASLGSQLARMEALMAAAHEPR